MQARKTSDIFESFPHRESSRKSISLSEVNYSKRKQTLRNILESAIVKSKETSPIHNKRKTSGEKINDSFLCGKTSSHKDMRSSSPDNMKSVMDAIDIVRKHILARSNSKHARKKQNRNTEKKDKIDSNWVKTVLHFLHSKELRSAIKMCSNNEKVDTDANESDQSNETSSEYPSDISSRNAVIYPRNATKNASFAQRCKRQIYDYRHKDRSANHTVLPGMNHNMTNRKEIKERKAVTCDPPSMRSKEIQTGQSIKESAIQTSILEPRPSIQRLDSRGYKYDSRHEHMSKRKSTVLPETYANSQKVETANDNSTASHKATCTTIQPAFHPNSQIGYITHCNTDTQTPRGKILGFKTPQTFLKRNETVPNILSRPYDRFSNNTTKSRYYRPYARKPEYKAPMENLNKKCKFSNKVRSEHQQNSFPHNASVKNEIPISKAVMKKSSALDGPVTSSQPRMENAQALFNYTEGNAKLINSSCNTENCKSINVYESGPSRITEAPMRVKSDQPIYSKEVYESFPIFDRTEQPKYVKKVNHLSSKFVGRDNPVNSKAINSHECFGKMNSGVDYKQKDYPSHTKKENLEAHSLDNSQLRPKKIDTKQCPISREYAGRNTFREQPSYAIKYDPAIVDPQESSEIHEEKIDTQKPNSDDGSPTSTECFPKSKKPAGSKETQTSQTTSRFDSEHPDPSCPWFCPRQLKRPTVYQPSRKNPLPHRFQSSSTSVRHPKTDQRTSPPGSNRVQMRKKEFQKINRPYGSIYYRGQKFDYLNPRSRSRNKKFYNNASEQIPNRSSSGILTDVAEGSDSASKRTSNREQIHGPLQTSYSKRNTPMKQSQQIADTKSNRFSGHQEKSLYQGRDPKSQYINQTRTFPTNMSHKQALAIENNGNQKERNPYSSHYTKLAIDMIFRQKEFFKNHLRSLSKICHILVQDNNIARSSSESEDISLNCFPHSKNTVNSNSKELINYRKKSSTEMLKNSRKCEYLRSRDSSLGSVISNAPSRDSWRESKQDISIHQEDINNPYTRHRQYISQHESRKTNPPHNGHSFITENK